MREHKQREAIFKERIASYKKNQMDETRRKLHL